MAYDLRHAFADTVALAGAPESPLLTVPEVASYIKRDETFVRRTLKYECPYVQHGVRAPLFFFQRDVDVWLLKNTRTPVA